MSDDMSDKEAEGKGTFGLKWTQIPDQMTARRRERSIFITQNRLVNPKHAPRVFDWFGEFIEFTMEEQLQFAIAFKRFPKDFYVVGHHASGRTSRECIRHYYKHKHDGRFETVALQDWLQKKLTSLPLGDRRRQENFQNLDEDSTGTRSTRSNRKESTNLTKRVPIDVEIMRLLSRLPGASETYRQELQLARQAFSEREAAAKREHEAGMNGRRAAKEDNAKAKKEKGKAKVQQDDKAEVIESHAYLKEEQSQKSLKMTATFGELQESLENMHRGIEEVLSEYEVAKTRLDWYGTQDDAEATEAELDLGMDQMQLNERQETYDKHKNRILLLDKMLRALLNDSDEMDRDFDKEFANEEPRFVFLCQCLISAKNKIVVLELDGERMKVKLAELPNKTTRRGGNENNAQVLQDRVEEREVQLAKLRSLAEGLLETMSDEIEEIETEEQDGDIGPGAGDEDGEGDVIIE